MSDWIFDATLATFDSDVLERSKKTPVVVDFWAPWCGPCRSLAPMLEKLVNARQGEVLLAKVNTDEQQELAAQFRIQSLPTVVAFRDGKPMLQFMGAIPEAQIVDFLDRLKPSEADRLTDEAKPLEATDPAKAETLYRQALKTDPKKDLAILGLARMLVLRNQNEEAAEFLDQVSVGGEHGEEYDRLSAVVALRNQAKDFGSEAKLVEQVKAEPKNAGALVQLGSVLAAQGKYAEALEKLLSAGERDLKLAKTSVRETMVKIFNAIGARSPLADDYRAKLSSLLY